MDMLASWRRWLAIALSRRRNPAETSAWWWDIRARILAYLVARYDDPEMQRRVMERDAEIRARLERAIAPPAATRSGQFDDLPQIRLAGFSPPAPPEASFVPPPIDPPPEVVPVDAPPRRGRELRRLITDIQSLNLVNRRRLRWRWL